MTKEQAKNELRPLKDMAKNIRSIEDEILRLETLATRMTPNYESSPVSGTPKNKMEEAVVKLETYRSRLSHAIIDTLDYRQRCRDKIDQIQPRTLQTILNYYYVQDNTMEQTAELIGKSYQWTYELYKTALEKYAEI